MIQELRIGNWIMGELGNEMTVCSLYKNSIECDFDGGWCSVFCPKPIPLSKEILEKCGFKKEPNKIDIYTIGRLRLWIGARGSCLCYLVEEDTTTGHYIPNQISYLHDLQNLYYSLTKQELEYKP